jgi:AcrR family transcriptional regulator
MERDKKECILGAAARAFARFGFKKTSVEEIAKDAGVAKGTVYLAADTKEDLFYQAVHREVRAYTAEIAKLIDPRVPADQLLIICIRAGLSYLDERPLVRDLIFGNHHLTMPDWADRLDELRQLGRANVLELLRLGMKQGIFRDDLDVDEVAKIFEDVAIATHVFHYRGPDRQEKLERRLKVAYELCMNGLRHPAAHTHAPTPHAHAAAAQPGAREVKA